MSDLPAAIAALIDEPQYPVTADFPVELGYSFNTPSATENGNPLYWDPTVADELTGGMTVPPTTLSLWMRPHRWAPGAQDLTTHIGATRDAVHRAVRGPPERARPASSFCTFSALLAPHLPFRTHRAAARAGRARQHRRGAAQDL